jgi:hypothetical protein
MKYVLNCCESEQILITSSEPDNNFDDGDSTTLCGQEGMQVYPEQRAELVTTIAAALASASLSTQIIADESSSAGKSSEFDS